MVYGSNSQEFSRYGGRMDDETTQPSVQMERYSTGVKAPTEVKSPAPMEAVPTTTIPVVKPAKKPGFFARRSRKATKDSATPRSKKQSAPTDISGDAAAKAAANELAEDLEAMGYDLNCESFLSKGSHSAFLNQEDRYMEAPMSSEEGEKDAEVREEPEEDQDLVPEKGTYEANDGADEEVEMLNEEEALIGLLQQQNKDGQDGGVVNEEDLTSDEGSEGSEESSDSSDDDDSDSDAFSSDDEKNGENPPKEEIEKSVEISPAAAKPKFSVFGHFTNRVKKDQEKMGPSTAKNPIVESGNIPFDGTESKHDQDASKVKVEAKGSLNKQEDGLDDEYSTMQKIGEAEEDHKAKVSNQDAMDDQALADEKVVPSNPTKNDVVHPEDPDIPKELVVVKPQRSRRPAQVQARLGVAPQRATKQSPRKKKEEQISPGRKADVQVFKATESQEQTEAPHPKPEEVAKMVPSRIRSPTEKKKGLLGNLFVKPNVASKVKVSSATEADEFELVLPQKRFSSPFKRRSRSKSPTRSPRQKEETKKQMSAKGVDEYFPKQSDSGESTVIQLLAMGSKEANSDAKEKVSTREETPENDEKKKVETPVSPHQAIPTLTGSFVDYFTSLYSTGPAQEPTRQSNIPAVLPLPKRSESRQPVIISKDGADPTVNGLSSSTRRKTQTISKSRRAEQAGSTNKKTSRTKNSARSTSSKSSRRKSRPKMDSSVSYVVRDTAESTKKRPTLSEKKATPSNSSSEKHVPLRSPQRQQSKPKKSAGTEIIEEKTFTKSEKGTGRYRQQQTKEVDQPPPTLVIQVPSSSSSRKKFASKGPMRSPPPRKNKRATVKPRSRHSLRPKSRSDRSTSSGSKLGRKLAEGSELVEKLKLNQPEPNEQLIDLSQLEKVSLPADWAELNEAARTIEQMMSDVGEGSNGSMDDAEILLKSQTNMQDVEKALGILRKHAKKLGVRESDLLLATNNSYDSAGGISEMSMNSHGMLGESFLDVLFGGYFHK